MNTSQTSTPLENFLLRACYSDTDTAGVIHHARFLEFFERSRTEWLDRMGAGPHQLKQQHLLLVLREITLNFHQPGRLDDQLQFTHQIVHIGNSQFTLEQKAFRLEEDTEKTAHSIESSLLASAIFHIVCVNTESMKACPLPQNIRNYFSESCS